MQRLFGLLVSLLIVLSLGACGGGGSGGGSAVSNPTPPGSNTGSIEINWSQPSVREDGQAIAQNELQGYVLFFFAESELQSGEAGLFGAIDSLAQFDANGSQIGNIVAVESIETVVASGSSNIIVLNTPTQSKYEFEDLATGDTYYFAVSPFDAETVYGRISNTVSASL